MTNALHEFRIFLRATHRWRGSYDTSRRICSECLKTAQLHNNSTPHRTAKALSRQLQRKTWVAITHRYARGFATVTHAKPHDRGPLEEYDERVYAGRLRDDEHQRSV